MGLSLRSPPSSSPGPLETSRRPSGAGPTSTGRETAQDAVQAPRVPRDAVSTSLAQDARTGRMGPFSGMAGRSGRPRLFSLFARAEKYGDRGFAAG